MKYGYCSGYHLSMVTAPTVEPITLDEALTQCHANEGVEDDWFIDTIKTVRQDAENFTRRAFLEQTLQVSYDGVPYFPILLPRPPLIEVDSINIYAIDNTETVLSISDFYVDTSSQPGRIAINHDYALPGISFREINSLIIQYKAGYGTTADTVPKGLKKAMLLQLGYLYDCRSGEPDDITKQYHDLLNRQRLYL